MFAILWPSLCCQAATSVEFSPHTLGEISTQQERALDSDEEKICDQVEQVPEEKNSSKREQLQMSADLQVVESKEELREMRKGD